MRSHIPEIEIKTLPIVARASWINNKIMLRNAAAALRQSLT